jgi:hypothetical protein
MPPIKCKPCRINYNGERYRIYADGSVSGALTLDEVKTLGLDGVAAVLKYEAEKLPRYLPSSSEAKTVRHEASRLRRNRNARERSEAMRDLGLKRAPGGAFRGWE